jgi:mannosyltransferase OCH1-like enzyme
MDVYDPDHVKAVCKYTKCGIPKIIHQVWIDEGKFDLPESWSHSPLEWKKTHPEFIYILWEAKSSRNFIAKHFAHFLPIYDSFSHVIHRCDMIRHCALYRYGGFYSDMDNYPKENLEKHLNDDIDVYFAELKIYLWFTTANTNLIFAKREHPLFLEILKDIEKSNAQKHLCNSLKIKSTTGVDTVNRLLSKKEYKIALLPWRKFNPYSFVDTIDEGKDIPTSVMVCVRGGSWHATDTVLIILFLRWWWVAVIMIVLVCIVLARKFRR